MNPIIQIFFAAGLLFMSAVLVLAVRQGRRNVTWHTERVEREVPNAVERVVLRALSDESD